MLAAHISVSCSSDQHILLPAMGMNKGAYRLQGLLDLRVQSTGLEGNDRRSGVRVVGNGRAALGAEETVDRVAGSTVAGVLFDGAVDGQDIFGDDGDEGVGRATLALAVVAVVVRCDDGLLDLGLVGDGLAETVSGERHCGWCFA